MESPVRPDLTEREKRILDEHLKTVDEDDKRSIDAGTVLREGRDKLKHPVPH